MSNGFPLHVTPAAGSDSTTAPPAARKQPVRKVFGRREALVNGITVRFELRSDGVHVRRKRSRKMRVISFLDLWLVSQGQGLLKL